MVADNASSEARKDLVWNPTVGHTAGGQPFKGVQAGDAYISSMQVWTHNGPGDHEVIKAIKLVWSNGNDHTYGYPNDNVKSSTTFHKSERITKMVIYAGNWVDSIYYESTRLPGGWRGGGTGGPPHDQDIGNGVFVGLWGSSGSDIDSLGSVFEEGDTK